MPSTHIKDKSSQGALIKTIRLWDLETKTHIILKDHTDTVRSVNFRPDGNIIISGSFDTTIRLWDIDRKSIRSTLKGHTFSVMDATFSPDGEMIVSGSSDCSIFLWKKIYTTTKSTKREKWGIVRRITQGVD